MINYLTIYILRDKKLPFSINLFKPEEKTLEKVMFFREASFLLELSVRFCQ